MRVLIFGPPGAGKGTQAALLVNRFKLRHISTGNILREVIKARTETGSIAKTYMDKGRLVPDDIIRELAEKAIEEAGYDRFILDGYPRTVDQAKWLGEFILQNNAILDVIVSLKVPNEVIVGRLSRRRVHAVTGENYHLDYRPPPPGVNPEHIIQRKDDRPEAIRERLEVYHRQTKPVEAFFVEDPHYMVIDGTQASDHIHQLIADKLTQAASPRERETVNKTDN